MVERKAIMKKGAGTAVLEETLTPTSSFPNQRECTRCDGKQHLVGSFEDMGKYRCDTCEMTIGFDLSTDLAEFVSYRGLPQYYTKNIFGSHLNKTERRLP